MTGHAFRSRSHAPSVLAEEERAWVSFYQRAGQDPAIAAEVLTQLDLDPEMKREHLALYLCCREALRVHEARAARDQRIGLVVRAVASAVFVRLPKAARRGLGRMVDLVLACLPGPRQQVEPAATKVRRLAADPSVRAARTAFKMQAGSVAAVAEAAAVSSVASVPAGASTATGATPAGAQPLRAAG
jgi:hypothetical protein